MKTKKTGGKSRGPARRALVGRKMRQVPRRKAATEEAAQIHQNIYAAELKRE